MIDFSIDDSLIRIKKLHSLNHFSVEKIELEIIKLVSFNI